jgi:hypothetical protein
VLLWGNVSHHVKRGGRPGSSYLRSGPRSTGLWEGPGLCSSRTDLPAVLGLDEGVADVHVRWPGRSDAVCWATQATSH